MDREDLQPMKRPICWLRGHDFAWLYGWPTVMKHCRRCGQGERKLT